MVRRIGAALVTMLLAAAPAGAVEFTVKNCSGGVVSVKGYNNDDGLYLAYYSVIPQLAHKGWNRISCATSSCRLIVSYPPDYVSSAGRTKTYSEPTYKTDLCLRSADDTVLYEMYVCDC